MRIKISLLIIAIISIVFLIFNNNRTPSPITPINVNHPSQSKLIQKTQTQVIKDELPNEATIKAKDITLESIEPTYEYDVDPVIEKQLIIDNNSRCYQQLSKNKELIKYIKLAELKLSSKQKSFFKSYKKYCEDLNELHPEYKLTDMTGFKYPQTKLLATSQWGKIMSGEIDVASLSDSDISFILKKNDINILSQAPNYLQDYYQKIIHWDLEDVLQNHQYDYINYIQYLTHQLYLCERGADCSLTSTIMVRLCYQNSMNCGLDYPSFINSVLTQGQQSDIKLALNYLKEQYQ